MLNIKDSIKKTIKVAKNDLRFPIQWLHDANKTYLNVAKSEVTIFRRKEKQFDFHLTLKLYGEKLQVSSFLYI